MSRAAGGDKISISLTEYEVRMDAAGVAVVRDAKLWCTEIQYRVLQSGGGPFVSLCRYGIAGIFM